MKNLHTFENFLNEVKGPDWNRDNFDNVYWKDFINTAKKNRIKTISDLLELVDKKLSSISGDEWDEAKKILNIVESTVNEAASLTQFYSDSDKDVKEVAKEIDDIIDRAGFNINTKNELLTLITDLTDAYLVAMRNA